VEKYSRAEQDTDDYMVYGHFMMNTEGYKKLSDNIMFISFPLKQWLHKRASILR